MELDLVQVAKASAVAVASGLTVAAVLCGAAEGCRNYWPAVVTSAQHAWRRWHINLRNLAVHKTLVLAHGWAHGRLPFVKYAESCVVTVDRNSRVNPDICADISDEELWRRLPAETFDEVVCSFCACCMYDAVHDKLDWIMSEVRRVLKPGGRIYCKHILPKGEKALFARDEKQDEDWRKVWNVEHVASGGFRQTGAVDINGMPMHKYTVFAKAEGDGAGGGGAESEATESGDSGGDGAKMFAYQFKF